MKVAVFNTKPYDREYLTRANQQFGHDLLFLEPHLNLDSAPLAEDFPAVCVFVNDTLNADVLHCLAKQGTRLIALRCAGYNNVDLKAAQELSFTIVRVPAYSPYAVAEHAVALLMTLNRKTHRAFNRVREGNFALEGLLGFDVHGKTVGVIGTGKIGYRFAEIMKGFGCPILAYDPYPNPAYEAELGLHYVSLETLFQQSDIISLHCPLTPNTFHIVNDAAITQMKPGVVLINTSRGAVIDTSAIIRGLKSQKIGALGLDVYEEEESLFFEDLSGQVIQDDVFMRLLTFPNVLITGHQAFFTDEALKAIANTTLANISEFEQHQSCQNQVALSGT